MAHAISSSPRLPTFAYSMVVREPTLERLHAGKLARYSITLAGQVLIIRVWNRRMAMMSCPFPCHILSSMAVTAPPPP